MNPEERFLAHLAALVAFLRSASETCVLDWWGHDVAALAWWERVEIEWRLRPPRRVLDHVRALEAA